MKKVVLALLAMVILSACSFQDTPPSISDANESAQSSQITMLDEGVWPTNTYTDGLPIPAGTVSWAALLNEQMGVTPAQSAAMLAQPWDIPASILRYRPDWWCKPPD